MIRYIIFDLSEVIISGYKGSEDTIGELLNKDPEEVDKYLKSDLFLDLMEGKITEEEYIDGILEETKWNLDKEMFKKIARENHNQKVPGTMEIIKRLKPYYGLALLSDHVEEWIEHIAARNSELEIFDKKFYSYQIGSTKKSTETFHKVLKELNVKENEVVFVDDSITNIKVAESIGIESIHFLNAEQLEKELEKRNIL